VSNLSPVLDIPYHEVCAELYRRKNFTIQAKTPWGIHEKQLYALQLLNSPLVTSLGYGGSGRSGKTWIGGEWLTMNSIAFPGTGWGLGRKELKNLKRTSLMTLFKVFLKYRLKIGIDYNYNQQDQIITFYNKSQIFLIDTAFHPQDPFYTRFGGYELTGALVDESNETPYMAIEILKGRLGFRKNVEYNLPPRLLETFNPDKGHVYERYYKPYKDEKEPPEKKFIKALPTDNPDPAVKIWIEDQVKSASDITIQRLVHGNFDYDDSKDKLIEEEAKSDYFTNEQVVAGPVKYITSDIARLGDDSTMIRVWAGYRVVERVQIFKSKVTETAAAIRALATKYSVPMSKVIVDEDGVGGGVRDILNCYGFIANSKPIGITNYANLKAQCTFLMSQLINDRKVYEPCDNIELKLKIKQEMDWVRERDPDSDGKRKVIQKEEVKQALRRSPDEWDSIYIRAYFELGMKL
jgi:phage terminase large subunit